MVKRFTLFCTLFLSLGYSTFCFFIYQQQRVIQHNPIQFKISPEDAGLSYAEMVNVRTIDGIQLEGWYIPHKDNKKTIVFFHGNGQLIGSSTGGVSNFLKLGYGVLFVEYRGYAGHKGKVTEEGLYIDAQAFTDWLIKNKNISEYNLIFYGESLGTALAVKMAERYNSSGVVLLAPFSSVLDVAKYQFWYLPVSFMLKDRFLVQDIFRNVAEPTLILHGDQDRLVPVQFGEQLYASNPDNAEFVKIIGGHHYGLYESGALKHIKNFLESL